MYKIVFKNIFILLILCGTVAPSHLFAQGRRSKIINIINQEINEVQRISNQTTGYNPTFELRKAELFLEKGRLERELENERFLKVNPRQRTTSLKKQYFKKSSNSFLVARQTCQQIIRKAPTYSDIGDVYYILAYYSKEQGDYNQALRNFNQSRRLSKSSELVKRSEIAMAEIFYANNRCDQSIKLYEKAIPRTDNKWKTKDLYNYSWCLYKSGKTQTAIRTMKESYRLSQQDKYINMSERIQKDIIVFYVQAQEYDQALDFINNSKGSKKVAVDELVERLVDGSETKQAANLLKKVINSSNSKEKPYYISKLYLIYRNTQWREAETVIAPLQKYLQAGKLDKRKEVQRKAIDFIGHIQQVLLNNKIDSQKNKKIMGLSAYKHAQLVKSPKSARVKINLVLAEIFQSIGQKKTAYDLYMKSFLETKQESEFSKIKDASLEGALLAVGSRNYNDLEKIYEYYLTSSDRDHKKQVISDKLFQVYMTNKKPQKAEALLRKYQRSYPTSLKGREEMLAQLFEYYEKRQSYTNIQRLISAVNSNNLSVSPSYKRKINLLSNNLIQKKANLSLKKGDWEAAIANYKKAYELNQSPQLKGDAALNISSLYSENKKIPNSILWLQKSLENMNSNQVQNSAVQINNLTSRMFYQGYIDQSISLQKIAWNRSCGSYSLFENLFILTKSSFSKSDAVNLLIKSKQCRSLIQRVSSLASSYSQELKIQAINGASSSEYLKLIKAFRIPRTEKKSRKSFSDVSNLSSLIATSTLSSNPETLVTQIKNLLNRLARMNSITSSISSKSHLKTKAFSKLLASYNMANIKIKKILKKNDNKDLNDALLPVIQTLIQQKKNVFASSMKVISQTPNYSILNHELLRNFMDNDLIQGGQEK